MTTVPLILASASPRRRELLRQIGVPHDIAAQDIDESRHRGETPRDYVLRMAREKAEAALASGCARGGSAVLAADTAVVVDDDVLGKPDDADAAQSMLLRLSDREHTVLTAIAVANEQKQAEALSISKVTFRAINVSEAQQYWQSGEPRDKAGAYAIQGLGAVFVQSLTGSYSGVMGLPLFETAAMLQQFHVPCWQPTQEY